MQVTLALPDDLEAPLRRVADAQHRAAEEVALDILREALIDAPRGDDEPDLATVVAAIRALPPNPRALRPGRGSLADTCRGWLAYPRAVRHTLGRALVRVVQSG